MKGKHVTEVIGWQRQRLAPNSLRERVNGPSTEIRESRQSGTVTVWNRPLGATGAAGPRGPRRGFNPAGGAESAEAAV